MKPAHLHNLIQTGWLPKLVGNEISFQTYFGGTITYAGRITAVVTDLPNIDKETITLIEVSNKYIHVPDSKGKWLEHPIVNIRISPPNESLPNGLILVRHITEIGVEALHIASLDIKDV